jgi:type IV pilus assembly protein PilB
VHKILIKKGYAAAEKLASRFASGSDIEYIETASEQFDPAALETIPEQVVRDFNVFPLNRSNNLLRLALGEPEQMKNLDKFRIISGMEIVPVLVPADEIRELIDRHFPEKPEAASSGEERATLEAEIENIRRVAAHGHAVDLVNAVIQGAVRTRATDIHLDPQEHTLRVRYRTDGMLYDIAELEKRVEAGIVSRMKILCEMDITNTRAPQDGHFTITLDSRTYDLRVATVPAYFGEKMVLRFIGSANIRKNLKALGMDPADRRVVDRFVNRKGGMLLVTGPMGSGKTTTLYAILNSLNTFAENIVTIEDPVEYQLKGVNQVQVNRSDLTYERVLRGALRLDIDTLMIGEIRDDDSAHIAVRAAVTGHRVLTTMHTNSALETITAMRHMGIKPFMIASALNVVIAQRLVRVICPHCKETYEPPAELLAEMKLPHSAGPFYHGKGCASCSHMGFYGRTAIFEVFKIDNEVKAKIIAGASADEIARAGEETVKFLVDRGAQKVAAGITTVEEVLHALGA